MEMEQFKIEFGQRIKAKREEAKLTQTELANKVSIDLLMGHKSKDVGERVYTHKTIEELKAAIMLLKF